METHFPFTEPAERAIQQEQLLTDLKVVARDIEGLLKSTAGDLSERASGELKAILERSRQLCSQLETQASASLRQADAMIREHPYQSMGVAFAVGALIGVLINRR